MRGFPKSCHTYQEHHTGQDSANVWLRDQWKQVPWGICCCDLISLSVISLKIKTPFAADGNKICLLIVEVLLWSAAGDLATSKKQRNWTPRNAVLLPPFFTEATILHGKLDAGKLLDIFAHSITKWAEEEETSSEADEDNDNNSVIKIEVKDAKSVKTGKSKQAATETLTTTADNYDNFLAFLQDVAVKYPRVIADNSPFAWTSVRASGYNVGKTSPSSRCPSRPHKTTWVSRAS